MTALMGDNPETSHDKSIAARIQRPESEAEDAVEEGTREAELLRSDEAVEVLRGLVDSSDKDEVPDPDLHVSTKL